MKRFDELQIFNRLKQRLSISQEWSKIIDEGTIGNLFHAISEGNAELARYLEYLYSETKWRNARNLSSLQTMADLIGYKRLLPSAAMGFAIVSHIDANGVARLLNYGTTFFDLDQASDFDDLTQNEAATSVEQQALVPWTSDTPYVIPKGTRFTSADGIPFISTETVESRALKEPYTAIKNNPEKLSSFNAGGGWNGIKYVKVPLIQGLIKNIDFTDATGTRFETFFINDNFVENAANSVSNEFFKVKVTPINRVNGLNVESTTEIWEQIYNIRLAGPYDKVFEKRITDDGTRVLIKFGDGITGSLLPRGARVQCQYLETLGTKGNVNSKFQLVQMTFPEGWNQIDPRTNEQITFLNCTNIVPIMGGTDMEESEELRLNAPVSYLSSYQVATKASYYQQILKNSPIGLLHLRIFSTKEISVESYGNATDAAQPKYTSQLENSVLTEVSLQKNAILLSGVRTNGTQIENPQEELIEPVIKFLADRKSPNDSFSYKQPTIVEIRPNVIISTEETLPEEDVIEDVKNKILENYSIFNSDFSKPYYKSTITNIAKSFPYTKYSEVFLEAKTQAKLKPIILTNGQQNFEMFTDPDVLLGFEFKFDKLFAQNPELKGFKNYLYQAPYLLRVDLIFKTEVNKNRTFFLVDNRKQIQDPVILMEQEKVPIDLANRVPFYEAISYQNYGGNIEFFDEYNEQFLNRQVRTLQFPYIKDITSLKYMNIAKSFEKQPIELRPLDVDKHGKNILYPLDRVVEKLQISINFTTNINGTGLQCYKKNELYIQNAKIIFNENYENRDDQNYSQGFIILPMNYIFTQDELEQLGVMSLNDGDDHNLMSDYMKAMLENAVEFNVYAEPLMDKFETDNEYTIICSNTDNILVEKNYLQAK